MAQLNWTYFSLTGMPYRIDMYHGDESGHLMLIINHNIVMIQFNQKETKSYSFLIEHQMLELEIEKQERDFNYTVTPQPLNWNVTPEKTFDRHFWIPLSFLVVCFLIGYYLILN